jgi:hypothetical protein
VGCILKEELCDFLNGFFYVFFIKTKSLHNPSPDDAAQLWREFLGAKLGMAPLALTYADVEGRLLDEDASAELLAETAEVFRAYDQARFSGAQGTASFEAVVAHAIEVCQSIDQLEGLS